MPCTSMETPVPAKARTYAWSRNSLIRLRSPISNRMAAKTIHAVPARSFGTSVKITSAVSADAAKLKIGLGRRNARFA